MNNLFSISEDNERVNIYMLTKILGKPVADFNALRLRYLLRDDDMENPFIFTALYQKHDGLHDCSEVYPIESIEYIAVVDKPRYSLFDVLKNKIKI